MTVRLEFIMKAFVCGVSRLHLYFRLEKITFIHTLEIKSYENCSQSKSKGLSMSCFDLLGTGSLQLIIGWESGKVPSVGREIFGLFKTQLLLPFFSG